MPTRGDMMVFLVALAALVGVYLLLIQRTTAHAILAPLMTTPTAIPSWTCAPNRTPPCNGPCP